MPNTTIAQRTAVANVTDQDEFEVQVAGETITKKATRKQITQIEETARISQDDVIEAGVGLSANGTYPSLTDAWYIRANDFITGITDRGGAEAPIAQSVMGALRMLDAKIHDAYLAMVEPIIQTATATISANEMLAIKILPKMMIQCPAQTVTLHSVIEILSCVGKYFNGTADYVAVNSLVFVYGTNYSISAVTFAGFVPQQTTLGAIVVHRENGLPVDLRFGQSIYAYMATSPTGGGGGYFEFVFTYRVHTIPVI